MWLIKSKTSIAKIKMTIDYANCSESIEMLAEIMLKGSSLNGCYLFAEKAKSCIRRNFHLDLDLGFIHLGLKI